MVPKSIGLVRAERTAVLLIRPMLWLGRVCSWAVWFLSQIGHLVLRILRLPVTADVSFVYSGEEIRLIVEESHEKGMLEGEEHELMQNVMSFGERPVRQIMVGRTKICGLPVDSTVDQALKLLVAEGYTRFPVYDGDKDHIVGMVHVKDLIRSRRRFPGDRPLRALKRNVLEVYETMPTDEVFEKMRAERMQMAVVLEETGGTAGIVTMEDLVEEVFGEVRDEFDAEEIEPITELADGSLRVTGDAALEDVADTLDRDDFDWGDGIDRVTGLVADKLGRPPRAGDVVEDQGLKVVVESVSEKTVGLARIYNLAPVDTADEDEMDPGT
jgi:CBS domain containing-hemolysin-like protein